MSREPLIAVIDDDEPFRLALVDSLCSLEYRARGFASAEEFFAANGESSCDCVVTDIHMPGMSGIELQLRLRSEGSRVPFVFVTAVPEESVRASALEGGAICFLTKPFDEDCLVACLGKALALYIGGAHG